MNNSTMKLATMLKTASEAHHRYETEMGKPDKDWHVWYADYLLNNFPNDCIVSFDKTSTEGFVTEPFPRIGFLGEPISVNSKPKN